MENLILEKFEDLKFKKVFTEYQNDYFGYFIDFNNKQTNKVELFITTPNAGLNNKYKKYFNVEDVNNSLFFKTKKEMLFNIENFIQYFNLDSKLIANFKHFNTSWVANNKYEFHRYNYSMLLTDNIWKVNFLNKNSLNIFKNNTIINQQITSKVITLTQAQGKTRKETFNNFIDNLQDNYDLWT